jgi:tyrosyl-tRNA synthetase
LGGNDQKFNLLVARDLQKSYNQKQQMIMTLPLLEGINGIDKMSKSLKNYIGINESENSIFGKLMSISDELMWKYLSLLYNIKDSKIEKLKNDAKIGKNPRDIKIHLAFNIVKTYHNLNLANKAKNNFISQFIRKNYLKINNYTIKLDNNINDIKINLLLNKINFTKSISESNRLISQNALKINNQQINDINLLFKKNITLLIKLGQKKVNVTII